MSGKKRNTERGTAAAAAQLRDTGRHPFIQLDGYIPLGRGETALYRAVREAVPVVDAAIGKLVRLCGGVGVKCADSTAQKGLEEFFRTVTPAGVSGASSSFLDRYLDDLFTCGHGLGEIVLDARGKESPPALRRFGTGGGGDRGEPPGLRPVPDGLWRGAGAALPGAAPLHALPAHGDAPCGVSLLRSMPFLAGILLRIFQATGQNWERAGNLRFAVVCRPGEGEEAFAQERCGQIAREWSAAMEAGRNGSVRDFVAVGDVDIKVIGADSPILDSQVPVRQILEQLVARTGIPPFMLGLSWSSTERMSTQQADLLTTEMTAIRRALTPAVERICRMWLRLHGYAGKARVEWEDINLQDLVEEARAEMYHEQAEALREERKES